MERPLNIKLNRHQDDRKEDLEANYQTFAVHDKSNFVRDQQLQQHCYGIGCKNKGTITGFHHHSCPFQLNDIISCKTRLNHVDTVVKQAPLHYSYTCGTRICFGSCDQCE